MNSKQYEKMRKDQLTEMLAKYNITEYLSVCLSTDQQEYEVVLKNGNSLTIPSGLPYHED
jgi:hypothetical protein